MASRGKKTTHTKHRSFVLVTSSGKHIGRYISKSPAGAAKKAGSRILKKKGQISTHVHIKETTQGSLKKTYKYIVRRQKLSQQKVVSLKGRRVTYKYKTTVKASK
jgi:hypothetical protein